MSQKVHVAVLRFVVSLILTVTKTSVVVSAQTANPSAEPSVSASPTTPTVSPSVSASPTSLEPCATDNACEEVEDERFFCDFRNGQDGKCRSCEGVGDDCDVGDFSFGDSLSVEALQDCAEKCIVGGFWDDIFGPIEDFFGDIFGFFDDVWEALTTCFSGNMEVVVQGKGTVAMEALKVGDYVKIGNGETYERVYAFAHHDRQRHTEFVQLHTNAGTPLEMTGEHLVFVDGKTNPVRADSIKVGDILLAESKNAVVEKVTSVTRNGIYSPLTSSGTIQVNGITASNYVSLQKEKNEYVELQGGIEIMSHHDFAHRAMTPFWLYCTTFAVCDISDSNSGLPVYVSSGIKLIQWSLQQHIALQLLLWVSFRMLILASIFMVGSVLMIPLSMISGKSIDHMQRLVSHTGMFGANVNKKTSLKKEI